MFMNEYDIDTARIRLGDSEATPNLERATAVLVRLCGWANNNSDGWAYWPKPARAATRLMELVEQAQRDYLRGATVADISDADLKKALTPIKTFLTRQNVAHAEVL